MHYFYILFSEKLNRFYVGESANPENRSNQHKSHYFKNNFTKAASDGVIKLKFQTSSKVNTGFLEKFTKRMKSRKFIEKIIASPAILEDILKNK